MVSCGNARANIPPWKFLAIISMTMHICASAYTFILTNWNHCTLTATASGMVCVGEQWWASSSSSNKFIFDLRSLRIVTWFSSNMIHQHQLLSGTLKIECKKYMWYISWILLTLSSGLGPTSSRIKTVLDSGYLAPPPHLLSHIDRGHMCLYKYKVLTSYRPMSHIGHRR